MSVLVNPYNVIAPVSGFQVDAADFDGTDGLSRAALSGASDGKQFVLSFWTKMESADTAAPGFWSWVQGLGSGSVLRTGTTKVITILWCQPGGATIGLAAVTATTLEDDGNWHHFIMSVDMADTGKRHIYIDGADASVTWTTYLDGNLDFTPTTTRVGTDFGGGGQLDGGLAEVFFHTTYLDLSVEANRELFRSSAGKPVDLGADGSTPLGVQPLVYLHLDVAEAAANFAVNAGSGGDYAITGTLTTYASSPSD